MSSLGTQSGGAREARDDAFESHVQAGEEGPNFPPPHHPPRRGRHREDPRTGPEQAVWVSAETIFIFLFFRVIQFFIFLNLFDSIL